MITLTPHTALTDTCVFWVETFDVGPTVAYRSFSQAERNDLISLAFIVALCLIGFIAMCSDKRKPVTLAHGTAPAATEGSR